MKIFKGLQHKDLSNSCALTIGNFDGVHRGHQAMIALLKNEAQHKNLPSRVLTFEPHPRDYFAAVTKKPELAPARIATLRDKLSELQRCGVDETIILPFDKKLANLSPEEFIDQILIKSLNAKYILVGDDFKFGAKRAGDYQYLDEQGAKKGFDVARMMSYEVHGARVSSTEVRAALSKGDMKTVAALLGRNYSISGHVVHGRKLGRELGFPTLNLRFSSKHKAWNPAASGIYVVQVHGLTKEPLQGVANLGVRPAIDKNDINGGRVLLETHCLNWNLESNYGYGKIIKVDLLHKLRDEENYPNLHELKKAISQDFDNAKNWFKTDK